MDDVGELDRTLRRFVQDRIKDARKAARCSQQELADMLGVSDKTISAWEVGRAEPSLNMLNKIAKATKQPLDFFVHDRDFTVESKLLQVEDNLRQIKKHLSQK